MIKRVGQQLGNYRLIRLLGQGGFADVYLAEHLHLGTKAAIKVLATRLIGDELEHFRDEARTIAHLKHAHIVRVLEFGIDGNTPFLVMDYAPDGTLRQQHPKGTRVALPTIVSYVKQVADALQYAHDRKLIHRDIKPENMLMGDKHEVLLSDFGIAIVAQSSRHERMQDTTGTIAYMAPEQIQAYPRPASDQYSLGVIVYEWLSGEPPFSGSFTEIAAKHVLTPPAPLRAKLPTLPLGMEQVVMTALAKDPKQRFATVQAFANALEQTSQPGRTKPVASAPLTTDTSQFRQPAIMAYPLTQFFQEATVGDIPADTPAEVVPASVSIPPPRPSPQQVGPPAMQSKPELAQSGISRRAVLVGLGLGGLVVAGGGIALLASSRQTGSSGSNRNTPTTVALSPLSDATKSAFGDIMKAKDDHVTFLVGALKTAARPKPTFKALTQPDIMTFAAAAQVLENIGVGAYLGVTPAIKDKSILAVAASILTVESRHAGFLNVLLGKPNPSFDKPLSQADVVKVIAPLISSLNGGPDPSVLKNDLDILNFALLLEYLEKDFYDINVPKFSNKSGSSNARIALPAIADLKIAFSEIMKAKDDHVTFLVGALKTAAHPKPTFKALTQPDIMTFALVSQVLEGVGVGAYLGVAPAIKDKGILAVTTWILTVESRHAGFLNVLLGKPNPSFDMPLSQANVINVVVPFIMSLNGGPDPSKPLTSDADILNFALLLEYFEKDFYDTNIPKFFP